MLLPVKTTTTCTGEGAGCPSAQAQANGQRVTQAFDSHGEKKGRFSCKQAAHAKSGNQNPGHRRSTVPALPGGQGHDIVACPDKGGAQHPGIPTQRTPSRTEPRFCCAAGDTAAVRTGTPGITEGREGHPRTFLSPPSSGLFSCAINCAADLRRCILPGVLVVRLSNERRVNFRKWLIYLRNLRTCSGFAS